MAKGEILVAESLVQRRPTVVYVDNRTPFHAGGEDPKAWIKGHVGPRTVYLVERPFDSTYVSNWKAFRDRLPVVPTLRLGRTLDIANHAVGPRRLLMTDLKADGSELYGANYANYYLPRDAEEEAGPFTRYGKRFRPRRRVDRKFVEITHPDRLGEVIDRTVQYKQLADAQGHELPEEDPFQLLVHPNGSWDIITSNLQTGKIQSDNARDSNTFSTGHFINDLIRIRGFFINKIFS